MDSVDTMAINISEVLQRMVRDYPFTLALMLVILLVSIPYNLMLSPSQYCGSKPPWAAAWMHLSSPFNIGCEANLMNLWTDNGALLFVGNFTFVLVFSAMVEYVINPIDRKLKRNIFVAGIMGAWLLELTTLVLFQTMSVGTSIIAVSLMVTLVCWMLYRGWVLRKKPLVLWIPLAGAVFLSIVALAMYSAENTFGHTIGGLYFLLFMVMFLKEPNWWEHSIVVLSNLINPRRCSPASDSRPPGAR